MKSNWEFAKYLLGICILTLKKRPSLYQRLRNIRGNILYNNKDFII